MALLAKIDARRVVGASEFAHIAEFCAAEDDADCAVLDLAIDTASGQRGRVMITNGFDGDDPVIDDVDLAKCIKRAIKRGADDWFCTSYFADMFDWGETDYDYTHEVVKVEDHLSLDTSANFNIGFVLRGNIDIHFQGLKRCKPYGARSFVTNLQPGDVFILDDGASGKKHGGDFAYAFGVCSAQK